MSSLCSLISPITSADTRRCVGRSTDAFYVRRLIRLLVDHVFDYDFVKLVWNVDLSLLSFYARHDGIDKFVARAIANVPEECLAILQVRRHHLYCPLPPSIEPDFDTLAFRPSRFCRLETFRFVLPFALPN